MNAGDVRAYGPNALLVECLGVSPGDLSAALRAADLPRDTDVVAGERTVVIECRRPGDTTRMRDIITGIDAGSTGRLTPPGDPVVIPVVFDGPDLDDVANRVGITVEQVVARFVSPTYAVAFCGFSPGFAYLTGLDPALHLPRRPSPRERVPAGSVALAAGYAAVYPAPSPGGWHLLGTTTVNVWSVERDPPALLSPPGRVRFERVTAARAG